MTGERLPRAAPAIEEAGRVGSSPDVRAKGPDFSAQISPPESENPQASEPPTLRTAELVTSQGRLDYCAFLWQWPQTPM
jgi:hypothetical protein